MTDDCVYNLQKCTWTTYAIVFGLDGSDKPTISHLLKRRRNFVFGGNGNVCISMTEESAYQTSTRVVSTCIAARFRSKGFTEFVEYVYCLWSIFFLFVLLM